MAVEREPQRRRPLQSNAIESLASRPGGARPSGGDRVGGDAQGDRPRSDRVEAGDAGATPRAPTRLGTGALDLLDACGSNDDPSCADLDPPLGRERLDAVFAALREIASASGLDYALRVGELIIRACYAGDALAWRSRGPKAAPFRQLAQHPDLPVSPGTLYRCVSLYEVWERLQASSRWEHLGASHFRAVLGLPGAVQEKLLATANAKRWSTSLLAERVAHEKARRAARQEQAPSPPRLSSGKRCRRRV